MATYTTVQGDTWDSIAFQIYGDEGKMKDLIVANWKHIGILVFSAGIKLTVPDIDESEIDEDSPFWRQGNEESNDYEYSEEPDASEDDLTDEDSEDEEDID